MRTSPGFTIIEVLVAIGIMSILTMAMIRMSETSFMAARAVRQSTTAISVRQGVNTVLNSISLCAPAFKTSTPGLLNLGTPWTGPTAVSKIEFGTETMAEVGQVHGELETNAITLTKQEGPFDVQVNTTPTGPTPTMQMMKRYAAVLTLTQKKSAGDNSTTGGTAMQSSAYYMILTVDNTGRLYNCYGGAQWDMLRDICVQQLDGEWDPSKVPACLIRRLTISDTFAGRQAAHDGTFGLVTNPGPPLQPGLTVDGPIFARGFVHMGDIGAWKAETMDRSWVGVCPSPTGVTCPNGLVGTGYLHIAGKVNAGYPRAVYDSETNDNARRVVGLFEHLVLPAPYSRLWVGTANIPNSSLPGAGIFHVMNDYGPGSGAPGGEATALTGVFQANRTMGTVFAAGAEISGAQGTYSLFAVTKNPIGTSPYWYFATAKNAGTATDQGLFIGRQAVGGPNTNHIIITPGNTVNFPEGKVRIGGGYSAEAAVGLAITGDLNVTGTARAALFLATSDERLKTNVQTINGAADKLRRLSAKRFQWLGKMSGPWQIGVLAQDVEKEFPELVRTGEDGYKSVDYAGLSAVVLQAFKELDREYASRLESLEDRIQKLERAANRRDR